MNRQLGLTGAEPSQSFLTGVVDPPGIKVGIDSKSV
jgi:hypothetical protein